MSTTKDVLISYNELKHILDREIAFSKKEIKRSIKLEEYFWAAEVKVALDTYQFILDCITDMKQSTEEGNI